MQTIVLSFSGGRTSAYMTKYMLDTYKGVYNFIVIFANTGQEHPKTLEFVNNCDKYFGFNTVWVEAIVHHGERKSNTAKIVTYETASRNGEPFEESIKKHGIPNVAFPHCSRELKSNPIANYIKSLGYKKKDFKLAIGIRADETRRVTKSRKYDIQVIYPLVDLDVDKDFVLAWWKEQLFDLEIQEQEGNCTWCWKKSDKKHFMNIKNNPAWYDFPRQMEKLYPHVGPHKDKSKPRTFFRVNRSTDTMFKLYELSKDNILPISDADTGGCGESCEILPTE